MVRFIFILLQKALLLLLGIFVAMLVAEALYRYQVIDFYSSELEGLNGEIEKDKPVMLVFGDSFTAKKEGYVDILREYLPQYQIVNSAISGTGIYEASYIAEDRIETFKPAGVIFQLYVGNDLIDIRHPINWEKTGAGRNIYWWLCDRFHVLRYMNYKLAGLRSLFGDTYEDLLQEAKSLSFSPETYSERTKMYIAAEKNIVSNCIMLKNGREKDMEVLLEKLSDIITSYDPTISTTILVIPHCTQVNEFYYNTYLELGAEMESMSVQHQIEFPFVNALRKQFESNKKVTIVNALPTIQATEYLGKRLYFENDPHLNESGDEELAELINIVLDTNKFSCRKPQ